ncbi:hypothetical protein [Actinomadura fibrosa]|uniref:Uncharacterized protein n=1 Tax=Actinomadura fibrosa TaxID=111802 RepID=A0ABW2XL60_9ACTN|nr:hypothetical protein [Actinomadura fibrosa]
MRSMPGDDRTPWAGGGPPPPGAEPSGPPAPGPVPEGYPSATGGAVRYLPVTAGGEVIGFLWAGEADDAAGFLRRLSATSGFRAPLTWQKRFVEAKQAGLGPLEALRRWAGSPEDPEGGGIAADADEQRAGSLDELRGIANPGHQEAPVPEGPQFTPDGVPLDRSRGWEPLSPLTLDKPGYAFDTDTAVRYLPVVRNGDVVGYLWASETENAADYQRRAHGGPAAFEAGGPWLRRLEDAAREGLPALDALRRWKGAPEDPVGGTIPADAEERTAASLEELKGLARE